MSSVSVLCDEKSCFEVAQNVRVSRTFCQRRKFAKADFRSMYIYMKFCLLYSNSPCFETSDALVLMRVSVTWLVKLLFEVSPSNRTCAFRTCSVKGGNGHFP